MVTTCAAPADPESSPAPGRMRAIALLAAATLFMEALDGTIVAIALPQMARYFGADVIDLNLGMTGYLIALAMLLPLSNWMAERWGPRRVFTAAVAGFTLASFACAASPTLYCFIVARVIQGACAAMMTPICRAVVLRHTERRAMMQAVALLTWPALIAPAIAPPLGGLIVNHLSWQWIFLINLPIGVAGVIAALCLLPPSRSTGRSKPDWRGLVLWAIAISLLVGGVESAERFSPPVIIAILGSGGMTALLTWRHFLGRPKPLLDIRLIGAHRSFGTAIMEGSAFRSAILTTPLLLPLYFQVGLGKSIAETGLLIMIGMAGNIGMKTFSSFILRRAGFRRVLTVNGLALGAGFAAFIWTGSDTSFLAFSVLLMLSGLSRSLQFTTLNTVAFAYVSKEEIGHANTLLSTAFQINAAMGIAIGALAIQIGARYHGIGTAAAFHFAFAVIAAISILAALACLRHHRSLGSQLIT